MKPFSILDSVLNKSQILKMKYVGVSRILRAREPKSTSLEKRYYEMLDELKVEYIAQFPLDGRLYDAFIPSRRLLLEFDGTFWHPKTEADAKYGFQKKSIRVDALKNTIAKEHGYRIARIREEEPITSEQLKELIWG